MRKSSLAVASFPSLGGFVLAATLAVGGVPSQPALAAAGNMLVVTGDGVNVRFGPSTNTRIRQRVERDQPVMELQREGDWVRVEIIDGEGREGWIHGSLLAPSGGAPLATSPGTAAPAARAAATPPAAAGPAERAATTLAADARPPAAPPPPADTAMAAAPAAPEAAPAGGDGTAPRSLESVATEPGEVAAIAPEVVTGTRPAVGVPAMQGIDAPQTIEPAAAPPRDVTAELDRFRESVEYLNSRALSVAGVDLFTDVGSAGGGVVQVAATNAWSSIPPAGQQSYANTLLDRWAAARGYGGPVSVQIVDPSGRVVLESSKP